MVDQEDDEKILSETEQVMVACMTRIMLLVRIRQKRLISFFIYTEWTLA